MSYVLLLFMFILENQKKRNQDGSHHKETVETTSHTVTRETDMSRHQRRSMNCTRDPKEQTTAVVPVQPHHQRRKRHQHLQSPHLYHIPLLDPLNHLEHLLQKRLVPQREDQHQVLPRARPKLAPTPYSFNSHSPWAHQNIHIRYIICCLHSQKYFCIKYVGFF